jgi:hypothetical protein
MRTIEVLVSPTGEVVVTTKGFKGKSCQDASRQLEKALGVRQSEKLTTEYHCAASSTTQQEARQ